MRPILVAVVLVLNLWALVDLGGRRAPLRVKLGWALVIMALPAIGALAWLLRRGGRSRKVDAFAGIVT